MLELEEAVPSEAPDSFDDEPEDSVPLSEVASPKLSVVSPTCDDAPLEAPSLSLLSFWLQAAG